MARQRAQTIHSAGTASETATDFMSAGTAAKELGVTSATLRRWLKEGRLQGIKVGKQWRFRRGDLGSILSKPREEAAAAAPPEPALFKRWQRQLDELLKKNGLSAKEVAQEVKAIEDEFEKPDKGDPCARSIGRRILLNAVQCEASDLHFEPFSDGVHVRHRLDGVLVPVVELPREIGIPVVKEVVRWAALDPKERRAMDGCFMTRVKGRDIDARVSVMPAHWGHSVTFRIFDKSIGPLDLAEIGFQPEQLERYRRIIHGPRGLVLVTAPASSGKTTTIYASLRDLAGPRVKIMTAEDPIEYSFDWMSQCQINPDLGFGYAQAARVMLRSAPNVMFIGEARDAEIAELLCRAALTGHIVFSTSHTNSAPDAVARLLKMGVRPEIISAGLRCVVAQRLVRLTCRHCKVTYRPEPETLSVLGLTGEDRERKFYHGKGCDLCFNIGYRGLRPAFEVMELDQGLRAVVESGDVERIPEAARASGWRPLQQSALSMLFAGDTTAEELIAQGIFPS